MKSFIKIISTLAISSFVVIAFANAQMATNTVATSTTLTIATSSNIKADFFTKHTVFGNSNDEVLKLQRFLNSYENEKLPTTGNFHNLTLAAVKRFQTKYGIIPASGKQLNKTTTKLNEVYNADNGKKFVAFAKIKYIPKQINKIVKVNVVNRNNIKVINVPASKTDTSSAFMTNTTAVIASSSIIGVTKDMTGSASLKGKFNANLSNFFASISGFFSRLSAKFPLEILPIILVFLLLFGGSIYRFFKKLFFGNLILSGDYAKDNLEKIEGIGPKTKEVLYSLNITSFEQLSKMTASEIKKSLLTIWKEANVPSIDTWSEQAKLLSEGKIEEFDKLKSELVSGIRKV